MNIKGPGQPKLDFDETPLPQRSEEDLRKSILAKRGTEEKLDPEEEAYRLELIADEREDDQVRFGH